MISGLRDLPLILSSSSIQGFSERFAGSSFLGINASVESETPTADHERLDE